VIILTGADPAFCAGLDLKELAATDGEALGGGGGEDTPISATVSGPSGPLSGVNGPLPPMTKPVIGAINGVAITGGFELALACDFLIASEQALFADTHSRMGIMPGWGLTVLLAEAVGHRRAAQLSTTGNFLDPRTALAWGLVNEVVPHDELLPRCRALAADIVSNDQAGVRRILQTYKEGALVDRGAFWELEARVSREWVARGISGEEIEARRRAVTERGRAQAH
jgi:enoyl-CoA hydratase